MNLSFWELDTYFKQVDFVVVGSGIVGLSTAYHLKLKHPDAKILILEKGILPEGASTKNAGFACFGTISEILWYLESNSKEDVYKLVERRFKGLQKLRSIISDESMDYQQNGGYELFKNSDAEIRDKSFEQLSSINEWLQPIFGKDPFQISKRDFGFGEILGSIETEFEGQIHTGKMMRKFVELVTAKGIPILNNVEVTNLEEKDSSVKIQINSEFEFQARIVFLCTNAFTRNLYELDVVPARAQVLITQPIENLPFKGCFHMEEGFYYFRNYGNRILFGGGRNLDIEGETTMEFGTTSTIQQQLEIYLREIILPNQSVEIEHRWSGIMGMGAQRNPIVQQLSNHIYCGVRLTGTGVAIGSLVGAELADLLN